jgi:hypothetical protein
LREGDWIISSGYDSFNEVDTLVFSQPVQMGNGITSYELRITN